MSVTGSTIVYTVADPAGQEKKKAEREAASVVGTGRSLFELILPDDPITARHRSVHHFSLGGYWK